VAHVGVRDEEVRELADGEHEHEVQYSSTHETRLPGSFMAGMLSDRDGARAPRHQPTSDTVSSGPFPAGHKRS
jgi:hypothetical protein